MKTDKTRNWLYALTALVVLVAAIQLWQNGNNWWTLGAAVVLAGVAWGIYGLRKSKVKQ